MCKCEVFLFLFTLTVNGEVDCVLAVASWEGGVLADVGGLIRQPQVGEGDGGVLKGGRRAPHSRVLEAHALLEGRQHGHTESRVGNGHILLGAIDELLPGDLGDLHWGVTVHKLAAEVNLRASIT